MAAFTNDQCKFCGSELCGKFATCIGYMQESGVVRGVLGRDVASRVERRPNGANAITCRVGCLPRRASAPTIPDGFKAATHCVVLFADGSTST